MRDNRDELIERRVRALNELKGIRNNICADYGHNCIGQLDGLQIAFKIFSDNVDELAVWSQEENYPKFKMPPETDLNMEKADLYFQELIRRIHNALASITTYMDQARRIMKKIALKNTSFHQLYKLRVRE